MADKGGSWKESEQEFEHELERQKDNSKRALEKDSANSEREKANLKTALERERDNSKALLERESANSGRAKAKSKTALERERANSKAALERERAKSKAALERERANSERAKAKSKAAFERERANSKAASERERAKSKAALERERANSEREKAKSKTALERERANSKAASERKTANSERDRAKSKAALERERANSEKEMAQRSLGTLKTNPFEFCDRTASKPHIGKETHKKSTLKTIHVTLDEFPEKVWKTAYIRSQLEETQFTVDSEAMVVAEASKLVQALLAGLGLQKHVAVSTNRTVAGVELDIVLLYGCQRIPFAVIEVKKPGFHNFDDDLIFKGESPGNKDTGFVTGQNLDQLNALGYFGFESVFGMITNGNKWMLTSTTDFVANAGPNRNWDHLSSVLRDVETTSHDISPGPNIFCFDAASTSATGEMQPSRATSLSRKNKRNAAKKGETLKSKKSEQAVGNRVLYASQVVALKPSANEDASWEDAMKLLAKFVRIACASLSQIDPNKISVRPASCRVLDLTTSQRCSFQKMVFDDVNLEDFIAPDTLLVYLVASIGCGVNGDCCLGLSNNGESCCAVKFFQKFEGRKRIDLANDELDNWNMVYSGVLPACRVGHLPDDGGYLCMPYLRPIPRSERNAQKGNVKEALTLFAGRGYKHNDVRWRHFGKWKDGKLYLLDLGDIEKLEVADSESWISDTLSMLERRAIATEDATDNQTTPVRGNRKRVHPSSERRSQKRKDQEADIT